MQILINLNNQKSDVSFPHWNDFPEVDLYMDQVVELVNKYLCGFPVFAEDDKLITSSMINNYVKSKIMPPPVKKRYSRIHLAYIIMICTLKQTFNISTIRKILTTQDTNCSAEKLYNSFADNQEIALKDTLNNINGIFTNETESNEQVLNLISNVNIQKCIAERIVAE